jgi:DNA-binding XRE family transcriptional regulator
VNDRILATRRSKGWSQQELADRAGVTRQLVGAVEAGRHTPNVGAALSLARALGASVEDLFAAASPAGIEPAVGTREATDALAATVRVGDRLVAVAPVGHAVDPERWFVADAVLGATGPEWLPGARTDGLVLAGCDPVLGLLADLVAATSPHRVLVAHASTARAVESLVRGTVHGAVVHGVGGGLPEPPAGVGRWRLATWQVGLAHVSDSRAPAIGDLVDAGVVVVQREPGAGSQRALVRALEALGCDRLPSGPIADGHLDAVRRLRAGQAQVALTMEAAAIAHRLAFAPIEVHDVELWIDQRWVDLPSLGVLLDTLASAALVRRVERIGGYELAGCGTRVA